MRQKFCGICLSALVLVCARAGASDDFDTKAGSLSNMFTSQAHPKSYKWDLGVDVSYETYLHKSDTSATLNIDKVAELNEERFDLGLPAVPAGSTDFIAGQPRDYWEAGAHLYRQLGPLLSVGVITGFGFDQDIKVTTLPTAIVAPMYTIDYTRQIYYAAPSAKVGIWINRFRPYAVGGFGWYQVREKTRARLTFDPFNDGSPGGPFTTSDNTSSYTGLHFGGGIEVHVGGNGTISMEVRYHRIFRPDNAINLAAPGLRFSYLF